MRTWPGPRALVLVLVTCLIAAASAAPAQEPTGGDPFAPYREALGSSSTADRVRALNDLARKPPAGTEAFLADYVLHSDDQVRRRTLDILSALATPEAFAQLDRALTHPSGEIRLEAVRSIDSVAGGAVDERLVRAARDEDGRVAAAAVAGLRERDAVRHVPLFLSLLEAPDPDLRRAAIYSLHRAAAPEAVPALSELVWGDPFLGTAAVETLVAIGSDEAVGHLVEILDPPEGRPRPHAKILEAAVHGLRGVDRPETTPALIRLALAAPGGDASPRDDTIRALAIESARRHDLTAAQAASLVPLLDDASERIRSSTLRVLRDHAPDAAPVACRRIAADTSLPSDIRSLATQVIGASTAGDAAPFLLGLGVTDDAVLQMVIVDVLRPRVAEDGVVDGLLGMAGSTDDPAVAAAALTSIPGHVEPRHVPRLESFAAAPDALVRAAAASALGAAGSTRALPSLLNLAGDEDVWVRQAAAAALGELGDSGGREALVRLRKDPSPLVARAARKALENLPPAPDGS